MPTAEILSPPPRQPQRPFDLISDIRVVAGNRRTEGDWDQETRELAKALSCSTLPPVLLNIAPEHLPNIARLMAVPDRLRQIAPSLIDQLQGRDLWVELDPVGPDGRALPWRGKAGLPHRVGGLLFEDDDAWRWWPVSQPAGPRGGKGLPIPAFATIAVDGSRPPRVVEATEARLAGMWTALERMTGGSYRDMERGFAMDIGPSQDQRHFGPELPLAVLAAVQAGDLALPKFEPSEDDDA